MLGICEDIKSIRIEIAENGRKIDGVYINEKKVEDKYLDLDGIEFGLSLDEQGYIEVTCRSISKSDAKSREREKKMERLLFK